MKRYERASSRVGKPLRVWRGGAGVGPVLARARDHDTAGDDVLLELLEPGADVRRDQLLVVDVVDVADALLGEAVLVDAASEPVIPDLEDRVVDRVVDALDHRAQHVAWRLVVLVRVDADGELVRLSRGL